jgi:hypothetical protein
MNLERWVKIIGIVAGVASLASVAVTLVELHTDIKQSEIRDWQDTAVFSIVSHAPVTGISEADIQGQFNAQARDHYKELPREAIQTPALERTILRVISAHAIQQLSNGNFAFVPGLPMTSDFECVQISGHYIQQLVVQHPDSFNLDELQQHLKTSKLCELSDIEFNQLIATMTHMGAIINRKGKFSPNPGMDGMSPDSPPVPGKHR